MKPENATALRRPFPPESVGKLPKGGVMLDYVGHAAVTDRLLTVDPQWSWEPMALDQYGSPQCDRDGNLWIRLTICGVTRLGVGDGKNMKERVGDAIRNAAMRFGVALDLWAKENLVEFAQATHAPTPGDPPHPQEPPEPPEESPLPRGEVTAAQLKNIGRLCGELGLTERAAALAYVKDVVGRDVSSRSDLTKAEASTLIDTMAAEADMAGGGSRA